MERVEELKPYNSLDGKAEQVETMFDSIAPAYDFMNHAMTLGIDKWWRRAACSRVADMRPRQLLDVATGTGDFALQLWERVRPEHITGIDLSEGMMQVALHKVAAQGLEDKITFEHGDCMALPYPDSSFDAVTVAFGVRNFEHIEQGYREMLRVLHPGGKVCVLELSTPQNRFIRFFYNLYTTHIIPWAGSLKSGDKSAYRYLPQSIAAVPQGSHMTELMRHAGFTDCQVKRFTLGVCSLYTGRKPLK